MINREGGLRDGERERECCRQHAGMNEQTESDVSLFAGFSSCLFSAVKRERDRHRVRGEAGEVRQ